MKNTHSMGIRLDDETYKKLNNYSKLHKMSKSKILKKSFKIWSFITQSIQEENLAIINKNLFQSLFEMAIIDKLEEFSSTMANIIIDATTIHLLEDDHGINDLNFLNYMSKILSGEYFGLFNQFQFQIKSNGDLVVSGNHDFNKKFSLFMYHTIILILKKSLAYKLKEKPREILQNSISLEFKLYQT